MCLSMGTDIRLAGTSAYWRAAGINNGLGAVELGLSWTLTRAVGASRAFEICLSGRDVHAEEAERIGLVSRTVPDEDLMEETYALAERICGYSTHGVAMTKKVLWSALETGSLEAAIDMENRNQLLVRLTTQNLEEYIRARRDGRTPVYED
jgi:enoyl-CoA hydratase